MSKCRVFAGPYFSVFGLNTEIYGGNLVFSPNKTKYGPEKTPFLDTFHAVFDSGVVTRKCKVKLEWRY